ncbi:MAG: pilus assembly protein [Acidobacteria bacterium]|nr:pilus assembly protein [Acidobacteriota bacterium]
MKWLKPIRELFARKRTGNGHGGIAPLLAFYWSGGPVRGYPVDRIDEYGAFIRTEDFWCAGTQLQIRIQQRGSGNEDISYMVDGAVVECRRDGLEVQFLFAGRRHQRHFQEFLRAMNRRDQNGGQTGHSLVEFALLIPLLFLLIVNAVNFGGFFYAWITVANAARTGAQYRIMAGATVTSPSPPNSTQVYNVVRQDVSSLPNLGSLAVRVCTNTAGTIACNTTGTGTFANPAADGRSEASLYVMSWVDVQYTFQPLIPAFHFPGLGIHGTLPPTTVRRQSVMRMLQ